MPQQSSQLFFLNFWVMSSNSNIAEEEEEEKEEAFSYDDILKYTGQLGKYQLRTCLLLLLPASFCGIAVMCYSFTGFIPKYQ